MEPRKNISKHKPPSRIKYEQKNPVFTVRMPITWHDALKLHQQETGRSRKTILGLMLDKVIGNYDAAKRQSYDKGFKKGLEDGKKMGYDDAYNKGKQDGFTLGQQQGRDEGYKIGKDEWLIEEPCARCGKPLILKRDSPEYPTFKRWAGVCLFHRQCPP
jgi:hypothetical protein